MRISNTNLTKLIQDAHVVEAIISDPDKCVPINTHHRIGLQARKNLRAEIRIKEYARYGEAFQAVFSNPVKKVSFKDTQGLDVLLIDGTTCESFVETFQSWKIVGDEIVQANAVKGSSDTFDDPLSVFSNFSSKNKVKVSIIEVRDHSTSMGSIRRPFIASVNAELQSLKQTASEYPNQEYVHTLINFSSNHYVNTVHNSAPLEEVDELPDSFNFRGGNTALHDAVGKAIVLSQEIVADKHLIIITTDGEENHSIEYNKWQLKERITELNNQGNYTFVLCGPKKSGFWSVSATETAKSLGIPNVHEFENTEKSVLEMSDLRGKAYSNYAAKTSRGEATMDSFFDEN